MQFGRGIFYKFLSKFYLFLRIFHFFQSKFYKY